MDLMKMFCVTLSKTHKLFAYYWSLIIVDLSGKPDQMERLKIILYNPMVRIANCNNPMNELCYYYIDNTSD